jgi:hypothetical protein
MEQKLVDLLTALQASVTGLAPEAWNALVIGAHVDAVLGAAAVGICILILVVYALRAPKLFKAAYDAETEAQGVPPIIFLVLGGTISLVALIAIFNIGLDSRTWLGLLHPEVQVVRDLLETASQRN